MQGCIPTVTTMSPTTLRSRVADSTRLRGIQHSTVPAAADGLPRPRHPPPRGPQRLLPIDGGHHAVIIQDGQLATALAPIGRRARETRDATQARSQLLAAVARRYET